MNISCLGLFPTVEIVHRKTNTILPSSVCIERAFSYGRLIFGDNRHRLLDINFEKQLLLKVNKKFVKDIDLSKFI